MTGLRKELHSDRIVSCYADRPASLWHQLEQVFAGRGSVIAVVEGDQRLSYDMLRRQSGGAAAMLAMLGIGHGDRVAVMLPNGADAVRAIVAVMWLGGIVVPIGTRSRRPEIDYIFGDAEPAAVIYAPEFAAELLYSGPLAQIDVTGTAWRDALAADAMPPVPDVVGADLLGILYTSGTTGKPKGAMLTHFNVVHSCMHWQEAHRLTAADRTLLCVPWTHVSGLCGVLLPFLFVGGTLVTLADFKRRTALELLAAERITHALMVPAMYGLCLLESDLATFDLTEWRIAAYGGAPMPEPTIERFAATLPHLMMSNCYGATETTSPTTIMPPGDGTAHADSIGKVVRCGEIHVMDEHGHEVLPGEEGELWIGGPMVVPGYWRNPVASMASFAGGFWKSGDIGSIDADGFVRIADRKKDMIIRGGFKVYPAELESVLTGIDGVVEAAVVGRPDGLLGEGVVAFLTVTDAALSEIGVREWCAARVSDYKVPGAVVVRHEPLPRNANGKIQKNELRALAANLPATVSK